MRRDRCSVFHRIAATAALVLFIGLAASATNAQPRCTNPKGAVAPGRLLANLNLALRGLPTECDWAAEVRPNFPNSLGNGSYNIPVIAAAIALVVDPMRSGSVSWNMYTFWDTYLRGELGQRGNAWYYGGKELGSFVYQQYNIASVLAVHDQAWRTNRTTLRLQARDWLRATFAIHALSATPAMPASFHDRGQVDAVTSNYSGPWVSLPGMRSTPASWHRSARSILFARAAELGSNLAGEAPEQRNVRTWLEARWAGPGGSVYGLTATDRQHLRDVVQQAQVSWRIHDMLDGIRTIERLHLVRWGGVRATLLERNRNSNTAPTYGIAYFPTGQAHVLFPWIRGKERKGIRPGSARLDLAARSMTADNFPPTSSVHGQITATVTGLPGAAPAYHIVLEP